MSTRRREKIAGAGEPLLGRLPIGVVDQADGRAASFTPAALLADEGDQPSGLAKLLLRKAITAPFGPASICSMPAWRHSALDLDDVEQMAHLLRQRSEAVDQLGGEGLDGLVALDRRQPAVKPEPHLQVRHIVLGDEHRGAEIDARAPLILDDAALPPLMAATASSSIDW